MIENKICFVFCSDNIMLGNNSLIKANLTENYQRFSAKRNKNISQYSKEMDSGKTTISI